MIPTKIDNFFLKPAEVADIDLVLGFVRELAEYEKLSHECVATRELFEQHLFGDKPEAEIFLAYVGDAPIGMCLFFTNFSTFLGRPGLYLEDVYIQPEYRNRGFGKVILAFLASLAVRRGYGRFEWSVLDWNEPSIAFYRKLGAVPMDDWTVQRVSGSTLTDLANQF
jgi:GNAT superfamily N-acetyltransferase